MLYSDILIQLKSLGSEQTRKTYARHGIVGDVYGVSFAHLTKLKKQIKQDHAVALQLWKTGNFDAQCLALMIAEAEKTTYQELQQLISDVTNRTIADMLATFVQKTAYAQECIQSLFASEKGCYHEIAWGIIGAQALSEQEYLDAYFENYLHTIETALQSSANFTKYAMNKALIAIGGRNKTLKMQAQRIAQAIGKVVVDHGHTACKTPDAYDHIERIWTRKKD